MALHGGHEGPRGPRPPLSPRNAGLVWAPEFGLSPGENVWPGVGAKKASRIVIAGGKKAPLGGAFSVESLRRAAFLVLAGESTQKVKQAQK